MDNPSKAHLYIYSGGDKAGVGNVQEQLRVIEELSRDSLFQQQAEANFEANSRRCLDQLQENLRLLTPAKRRSYEALFQAKCAELEAKRNFSRHVVCLDMDYFYAQCELLTRPELKEKLVGVGGSKSGGVLTTCNYEASPRIMRSYMAARRQ